MEQVVFLDKRSGKIFPSRLCRYCRNCKEFNCGECIYPCFECMGEHPETEECITCLLAEGKAELTEVKRKTY